MNPEQSLHNHLLIAMPGMQDPNFSTTVTLVCEHNDEGALGIVINRPSGMTLGGLFRQLSLDTFDASIADTPVLHGGPVSPERGFILHEPGEQFESSVTVSEQIQLTLSRDVLDSLAAGRGPLRSLIALGYAGWQPGQLEFEILHNSWLSVPATPEIIFDTPFDKRWHSAAQSMGVDISRMSPHAGHA